MDVGVFEEKTSDEDNFNSSKDLNSSGEDFEDIPFSSKEGIAASLPLQIVIEHRPPSRPQQRVILGASALRKLQFHVNVAERCLEIEEEHYIEDD